MLSEHSILLQKGDGHDDGGLQADASPVDIHAQHQHQQQHAHSSSARTISEKVPLYAAPRQRQRWEEQQSLPHVNWGDLYFDLFYVAAAYNLSHGFKDAPTLTGLLYFLGCYFPVFSIWNEKLSYDSRYCPEDNLFHRSVEVLQLCVLGAAIWHIRPSHAMENTMNDPTTMIFCGCITVDTILYMYLYFDIFYNVQGGPEARNHAWLEVKRKFWKFLFYVAAFAIAAVDYYYYYFGVKNNANANDTTSSTNRWPIILIVAEFVFEFVLYSLVEAFVYIPWTGRSHKEFYVPVNIEFLIHRIGEWVMLMLGESVLSILTSKGDDTWQYATSFFCGILTITMFQYLFFRSQPTQAKDHAMRRSREGSFLWIYMHTIYSASLILVGCSYKMMLDPGEMEEENEERGVVPSYDLHQRIAFIYALSQFVSFLSLDFMLLSHRGLRQNFQRFVPRKGKPVVAPWIVGGCNLLLLCGTLFGLNRIHDMTALSVVGCLLVFGQVILRTVGMKYFPISVEAMERAIQNDYSTKPDEKRRWPNVTEPGN